MAARQVPGECRHMRVQLKHCWMMVLLCLITSEAAGHSIPQGSSNPDSRPQVSQPASEWTRVVPGRKGTSCSDGSRYSFLFVPAIPNAFLFIFMEVAPVGLRLLVISIRICIVQTSMM